MQCWAPSGRVIRPKGSTHPNTPSHCRAEAAWHGHNHTQVPSVPGPSSKLSGETPHPTQRICARTIFCGVNAMKVLGKWGIASLYLWKSSSSLCSCQGGQSNSSGCWGTLTALVLSCTPVQHKSKWQLLVLCLSRPRELHGTDKADTKGTSFPLIATAGLPGLLKRCMRDSTLSGSAPTQLLCSTQASRQTQEPPSFLAAEGELDQIQICSAHQKIAPMGCSRSQT